jgi:hypothetical protein
MKQARPPTREIAETVAIQALTYIAADAERLGRFLAVTGVGPAEIRNAAADPAFLIGVLEYLMTDEALLTGFAAEAGLRPEDPAKAFVVLGGHDWEREVP